MTQKYDFARFKSEINLTQYAAAMGYEIDRKNSTKASVKMKNGCDTVIISKRNAVWVYFSPVDDRDNGTIINFVQNRTGKSLPEVGAELQSWIGGGVFDDQALRSRAGGGAAAATALAVAAQ